MSEDNSTQRNVDHMNRGEIWRELWKTDDMDERLRLVMRWERETSSVYYEGEPSKERKLRQMYKLINEQKGTMK